MIGARPMPDARADPNRADPSRGDPGREGPTAAASVELRGLRRAFGATQALDGLSLAIAPGELVALLGPSGCGKTTALRVVAGFETLDAGQVLVDGRPIDAVPAQKRNMGMVFQSYSLFPNLTARDNVAFGLRVRHGFGRRHRSSDPDQADRVAELLELVGLGAHATKYPHQMSGGQQQRVALARALAIEPRVLLLDEPLSALDAKVRLQLREQIRLLQVRLGIIAIFVTHDQEEALSIADRVCVMRDGRIEQVDVPSVVYSQPANPFVAQFVGTMNRIPGAVVPDGVAVLGHELAIRAGGPPRPNGTRVDVLVRPEELALTPTGHGAGIVMAKTFLGSVNRVHVLLDGAIEVEADLASSRAAGLELGTAVDVTITAAQVLVDDPAGADPTGPNGG